jgi:hypothetical protein
MTGGRTRPTHEAPEIEALVSSSRIDLKPRVTVEQQAIAAPFTTVCRSRRSPHGCTVPLGLLERVLFGLHSI